MCGRYVLRRPGEVIEETLDDLDDLEVTGDVPPSGARFNVAPTQEMPILLLAEGEVEGAAVRVQHSTWSFTGAGGRPLINARSESVADRPSFAESFRHRRCLVPADGFFEWRPAGNRQPFFFQKPGSAGFCFAGLWQPAGPADGLEYCIVTAEAGPGMAEIHHRRPLILGAADHALWLAGDLEPEDLPGIVGRNDPTLTRHPVSFSVNRVANDDASLLEPVREAPENLSLF